jgi:hypothetical protein
MHRIFLLSLSPTHCSAAATVQQQRHKLVISICMHEQWSPAVMPPAAFIVLD